MDVQNLWHVAVIATESYITIKVAVALHHTAQYLHRPVDRFRTKDFLLWSSGKVVITVALPGSKYKVQTFRTKIAA